VGLADDGTMEGDVEGDADGAFEGDVEGDADGAFEGGVEGDADGAFEGDADGAFEGDVEGDADGAFEGDVEGDADGAFEGDADGAFEGDADGAFVGDETEGCTVGTELVKTVGGEVLNHRFVQYTISRSPEPRMYSIASFDTVKGPAHCGCSGFKDVHSLSSILAADISVLLHTHPMDDSVGHLSPK